MVIPRRLLAALLLAGCFAGVADAEEPPAFPAPSASATQRPSPDGAAAYLEELSQNALKHRLYESRRWLLLLHARPDGAGGWKSEVDGPKFFLAKDGKTSPRAEMLATLAAFVTPPADAKELPACRFPARWKFLEQELHFDPARLSPPSCAEYADWRNEVNAGSVTLVFASAFIGSPASTYGHTFLRIDKKGVDSPLLALAVEFAANPTTFNPILYPLYGLFGGFEGHFFSRPYFSKVQEYSNLEARDLWEYKLKLDDDQIDWMVRHLWELDVTWFDYYFASENCSYQLLGVLDVAVPEAHLAEGFPATTVPADTVRAIVRAGLVEQRTVRDSQESILLARRALLRGDEVAVAEKVASARDSASPASLTSLPPERQALVLDAAFDLFKHRYGFFGPRQKDAPPDVRKHEDALAFERSLVKIPGATPAVPPKIPPEDSHASTRAGIGVDAARDRARAVFDYRLALHDLLDRPDGYAPDTVLEMLAFRLRLDPQKLQERGSFDAAVIDRLDVVRIVSVTPRDRWIHPVSWRFAFGGGRVPDVCGPGDGWKCTAADVEAGFGQAVGASFPFETVWYAFVDANPAWGPAFFPRWRAGGDVAAGTVWGIGSHLRANAEARLLWNPLGDRGPDTNFAPFFRNPSMDTFSHTRPDSRIDATLALSLGKNQELRAGATWIRGIPEARATILVLY